MNADILLLADVLASELQARITIAGLLNTSVSREYEVTTDLGAFTDRRIEIYPLSYVLGDDVDRESENYDFRYSLVWMRRYSTKGLTNKQWIDDEVTLVQNYIVKPLDNPDGFFINCNGHECQAIEVAVTSVYDFDMLRQHKVFWSEVEVSLRKIATELG